MPEHSFNGLPAHIRGLNPDGILGVLRESPAEPPPVIPGWRIEGIAGRGGMGRVWRASRESDGRRGAVKVAPAEDAGMVERLQKEAAALRALTHPHIVRLLDSGPVEGPGEGGIFLVMEYVEGLSLAQIIPPGGLAPARAHSLFRRVAEAVSHAHGQGILHRDLKPGNILMAGTAAGAEPDPDHPMVADFGLARPVHERVQHLSLTGTGLIAGTADYLPPEAYLAGSRPDVRGDIYALGVIFYEMLTGGPPRGAWEPAALKKRVDIRVDGVIGRALHPDPARRWPDADSMLRALAEILASPPRYAGAPLITFPVRVADCLWTFLGLGLFLAGGSTLARLAKSKVVWPPDLIGEHGLLTGGFHGLFFLLLAGVPLAGWQLWRLWRFRGVPMREALPAPFGLSLPPTGLTALLVAAAQGICLMGPVWLMLHIFISTGLSWIRPGDPPWVHGLAVTSSFERAIHPLWERGKPGVNYWLRETHGPPEHPLSFQTDRVDFFPGTMPVLMLGAGLLLGTAAAVTFAAAAVQWWRRKHRFRPFCAPVPPVMFSIVAGWYFHGESLKVEKERDPGRRDVWVQERLLMGCREFGRRRLAGIPVTGPELASYAAEVHYREAGKVPRGDIPALFAAETASWPGGRRITPPKDHRVWKRATGAFVTRLHCLETTDPPDGSAAAALITLKFDGFLRVEGGWAIHSETVSRTPLYQAESRPLSPHQVQEWTGALLAAVAAAGNRGEALRELFHSHQLFWDTGRTNYRADAEGKTREQLVTLLESGFRLTLTGPCRILGPEPGGRTRVLMPLRDDVRGLLFNWRADLISTGGKLLCVRLQLADTGK